MRLYPVLWSKVLSNRLILTRFPKNRMNENYVVLVLGECVGLLSRLSYIKVVYLDIVQIR